MQANDESKPVVAMTIAGSDSGGGAGIQADLKTFAAHGVFGTSVVTAVTAQNTVAVTGLEELSTELVGRQIDAVVTDIGVQAVKIGMLSSSAIIQVVAERLTRYELELVVVDPVMVAKSGDHLLAPSAVASLRNELVPRARLVTPNLPEAEALVGFACADEDARKRAAAELVAMGAGAALVKGGHGDGDEAVDWLYAEGRYRAFRAPRVETRNTHGTGCTFSSAITAQLARGRDLETAIERAKTYLTQALEKGVAIGKGHGPVDHFVGCKLWDSRN